MTAGAGGWPPLDIVGNAEGREDELVRRLRHADAVITAVGSWAAVTKDPANALAEIGRLVRDYRALPWVDVDPAAEAARVRRAEGGDSDGS